MNDQLAGPPSLLLRYDAMLSAIAECHRFDEAKEIHDKAAALQAYARQARNVKVERVVAEIRLRAARRAGELLIEMEASGQREGQGGDRKSKCPEGILTLDDLKVSPKQSGAWQRLAEIDQETFDEGLLETRGRGELVSTAGFLRAVDPVEPTDDHDPDQADYRCPNCGFEWNGEPRPSASAESSGQLYPPEPAQHKKKVRVHFANRADMEDFSKLIGQPVTRKTRRIKFPLPEAEAP